jgi:hypothetical protein
MMRFSQLNRYFLSGNDREAKMTKHTLVALIIGASLFPGHALPQSPKIRCSIANNGLEIRLHGNNPTPDTWHCDISCFFTTTAEDDYCHETALLSPPPGDRVLHTCPAQHRVVNIRKLSCQCYNLSKPNTPVAGCGAASKIRSLA